MAWLSNGITLRNAAQVFGASCSSKRAGKAKSPAWTMSWLIHDTHDAERRERVGENRLQPKIAEARTSCCAGPSLGLLQLRAKADRVGAPALFKLLSCNICHEPMSPWSAVDDRNRAGPAR